MDKCLIVKYNSLDRGAREKIKDIVTEAIFTLYSRVPDNDLDVRRAITKDIEEDIDACLHNYYGTMMEDKCLIIDPDEIVKIWVGNV